MNLSDFKIHIVGAGVSGLIAAGVLEEKGYRPVILEAADGIGGRLKTDWVEGWPLDHGFQVLLTAYPLALKYLDFESLRLQYFSPGAVIFKTGKKQVIGDPLRDLSLLLPTLSSNLANFSDKLKIFKLSRELKKKSPEAIFSQPAMTTLEYLENYGFSATLIQNFFKPFFSGIFLEPDLRTSSRMFLFVFKMFAEGLAALPEDGIAAIPEQLNSKLKQTQFRFKTAVREVAENKITLANGDILRSDCTIIAGNDYSLIPGIKNQKLKWKGCDNLYFKTEDKMLQKPLIGLITAPDALINNIFSYSGLNKNRMAVEDVLSVTVVKDHAYQSAALVKKVSAELQQYCGYRNLTFLKHYAIPKALPDLENPGYDLDTAEKQQAQGVFLAGDSQINASLNAAMRSGERAAQGACAYLERKTSSPPP